MNISENFVSEVSHKTFLSLWSFPNPVGKNSKELSDFLVVCDPYVIIFSVKHIQIKESGNEELDAARWQKRAIDESIKQIYGAQKFISLVDKIQLKDKKTLIALPEKSKRIIYRIAVAIGGNGIYDLNQKDFGKGFVHVFDEESFFLITKELDTIADFVNYLKTKENFIETTTPIISHEKDLLGYYIYNNRSFPVDADVVSFDNDIWEGVTNEEQYKKKKVSDEISYVWDGIIERMYIDYKDDSLINITSREQLELAFRTMAKETRLSRRVLSTHFMDFISNPLYRNKIGARLVKPQPSNGVAYVYMTGPSTNRDTRQKELGLRCFVARMINKDCTTIVGIATEPYEKDKPYSIDYFFLEMSNWTEQLEIEGKQIQEELGYFKNPNFKFERNIEYPE